MNVHIDSITMNDDGKSLEEKLTASGIDVEEAKSQWGKAMYRRL